MHTTLNNVIDWRTELNESWGAILLGVIAVLGLVAIARNALRNRRNPRPTLEIAPSIAEANRCACGEYATESAPYLRSTRSASHLVKSLYGFKRLVDPMRQPSLCTYHARLADSLLDKWIANAELRQVTLKSELLTEAAGFEAEGLDVMIRESLTESQKRKNTRRLPSNVSKLLPSAPNAPNTNAANE